LIEDKQTAEYAFLGAGIRRVRREKRWTQAVLGQRLKKRRLSRQSIAAIEAGKNTDLATIADIAAALGVSISELAQSPTRAPVTVASNSEQTDEDLVGRLLQEPETSWRSIVQSDPRYEESTQIRNLVERANQLLDVAPKVARSVALLAAELADHAFADVAELRVDAWKNLAHAAWKLGNFGEGFESLDKAQTFVDACSNPELQRAILDFVRAIIYSVMQRYEDSRNLLLKVQPIFEKHDRRRYLMSVHQQALLEYSVGNAGGAAILAESLLAETLALGDSREVSLLYTLAASAWFAAGDLDRAEKYHEKSFEMSLENQRPVDAISNLHLHANILAEKGQTKTAIRALTDARKRLAALGLTRWMIDADLDLLLLKAKSGANPRELQKLCRQLAEEALAAQLPITACEAINWLRKVSAELTDDKVEWVRTFVKQSEEDPERPFTPLAN
jgi:transcriptional regulator with XRE-family HTH domain